jgi:putative spermidine/putrescine transport system permease protein
MVRTRRVLRVDAWVLLVLPLVAFLGVVYAYPLVEILQRSFTEVPAGGGAWDNYRWFFETPVNVDVLVRTLYTGALVTLACLALGFPYAYLMTVVGRRARLVLLGIVLIPFWTSFMVRTYAWIVLLQDEGVVNDLLGTLGVGPVELIGSLWGVLIGMVQILMPFMVLPLYATLQGIDRRLLLAAASLGARPRTGFLLIYVPLALPGIVAGCLLVFVVSLGFYITPALLGSPSDSLLSQLIVVQIGALLEWGRGGAMAAVLLVVTLAMLAIAARLTARAPALRTERPDR